MEAGPSGLLETTLAQTALDRGDDRTPGVWELPVLGAVAAPTAVLIRPDGHVAWAAGGAGDGGLRDALTTWFGARNCAVDAC
jgi:3-(3-hydroxy-phenyl)propionate hydroxylase